MNGHFLEDPEAHLAGVAPEIGKGDHPDVGGVMPLVGQLRGHRGMAGQQQHQADPPVAEVGKADHALAAHAQHFPDQGRRIIDLLQGLGQDHVIEGVVGIVLDLLVDVPLQDRHALGDATGHAGFIDVDTGTDGMLMRLQVMHQHPVAAAQPEYTGPLGNPGRHHPKIVANAVLGLRGCGHRQGILS
ncbi:conserved hypothetical protein [Desulfosarcina cetonica]|nr:conserved hypothetical protein [Desulfosarcina cetonica]